MKKTAQILKTVDDCIAYEKQREEQEVRDGKSRELVITVIRRCPELFVDFTRLKAFRRNLKITGFNKRLHFMQMEMLYGTNWKWLGLPVSLDNYTRAEEQIIVDIASRYFEDFEDELRTGKFTQGAKDLKTMIEEAGIDVSKLPAIIANDLAINIHHSTRLFLKIHGARYFEEHPQNAPEELSYF